MLHILNNSTEKNQIAKKDLEQFCNDLADDQKHDFSQFKHVTGLDSAQLYEVLATARSLNESVQQQEKDIIECPEVSKIKSFIIMWSTAFGNPC